MEEYKRHGRSKLPVGLRFIVSLWAASRDEAAQRAHDHAVTYLAMANAVVGVPFSFPRTIGLLEQIDRGGRFRYQHRFYDLIPAGVTREIPLEALSRLSQELSEIQARSEDYANRVRTGLTRYASALAERDLFMRFLNLWIALETLGPVLNDVVHPAGARAACEICNHQVGVKRERGFAGMQHALASTTGNVDIGQALKKYVRDNLFHGLSDLESLAGEVADYWPALRDATGSALATILSPTDGTEQATLYEPLYANDTPDLVWDTTIIGLSEEDVDTILYHEPFKASLEILRMRQDRRGAVEVRAGGPWITRPEHLLFVDESVKFVQEPGGQLTL